MNIEQPEWLRIVREKVETLRFGVVQIVIHDSHVTQIERTEKTRLLSPEPISSTDQANWRQPQPNLERTGGSPQTAPAADASECLLVSSVDSRALSRPA
jgi:hypothetical protein